MYALMQITLQKLSMPHNPPSLVEMGFSKKKKKVLLVSPK